MKAALFGLTLSAALIGAGTANAAIVNNGDFETSNFNGWTIVNGSTTPSTNTAPVVIEYGQASGYPTGAFGEAVPAPTSPNTWGAYFSADGTGQSMSQLVGLAALQLLTR